MTWLLPYGTIEMCGLKSRILRSHRSPKPVITARTIITAATPSKTPKTETHVMTEVTERFGFRYLNAKKSGKGIAFRSRTRIRCTLDSPHKYLVDALDTCNKYQMYNVSVFTI